MIFGDFISYFLLTLLITNARVRISEKELGLFSDSENNPKANSFFSDYLNVFSEYFLLFFLFSEYFPS